MQIREASKFKVLLVTLRKTSRKGFDFTDLCNNLFSFYTFLVKKKRPKATKERRISAVKKYLKNQVSEYRS